MKNRSTILQALTLGVFSLLLSGCLEQETKTVVHPDGTSDRVITVSSDASPFPLHLDSSWDTSRTGSGKGSDSVKLVLRKTFPTYESLAREYEHSGDEGHFGVRVEINKKFRWFYTYYEYRETYMRFTRDTLVSPRTILTDEEITRYTYGDTSKTLKDKVEEWHNRNLYEILFGHIRRAAAEIQDDSATMKAVDRHKDDFYRAIFVHINDVPTIVDTAGGIVKAGLDSLVLLAGRVFEIKVPPTLRTALGEGVKASFEHALGPENKIGWGFVNAVSLPGVILDTNAPDVKGNTVTWKLTLDQLSLLDYSMRAESRAINVWATVVTGAVVLLLVGLLVWRGGPKREGGKG